MLFLIILCFIADKLAKKLFVRLIHSIVKKTKFLWDDVLLENKVFDRLAHLAPALVVQVTASYFFSDFKDFIPYLIRFTDAYMLAVTLMVVISVFNTLDYYFKQTEALKDKPIDSYFQLVRLVTYFIGGVLIVSKIFEKSKTYHGKNANGAVYILSKKFLKIISKKYKNSKDFINDILIDFQGRIAAYKCNSIFLDIGTVKNYMKVK